MSLTWCILLQTALQGPAVVASPPPSPSIRGRGSEVAAPQLPADAETLVALALEQGRDLSWLLADRHGTAAPAAGSEPVDLTLALADRARQEGLAKEGSVAAALAAAETLILAEASRRRLIRTVAPSSADVDRFIKAHEGVYDEYLLRHIYVAVGALPDGGQRSDAAALRKAWDLHRRLAAGADFATLAKEASEDKETAAEGGALPAMLGRYMADEFFPSVRTLHQDGLTDPVRGKTGYHLIRLDQRIPVSKNLPLARLDADLKDDMLSRLLRPTGERAIPGKGRAAR